MSFVGGDTLLCITAHLRRLSDWIIITIDVNPSLIGTRVRHYMCRARQGVGPCW